MVALPHVVAHGGALEADVADPVVRAGMRAAVEREPEGGDVVAEAPLEALDQRIEPGLRLGHAEVAVRLARAGDRATADRIGAEGQAGCLLDRCASRVDVRRCDRGDDDVLLAGDAEVAADPLGDVGQSEHLVTGEQADVDRDPQRDHALFVLGSDAEVVGARAGVGRQLEVG